MLFTASPVAAQDDLVFPPEITPTGTQGNWTLYNDVLGRVYGFEGHGYAVIAGGLLDEVCTGEAPPEFPRMVTQTRSGTWKQQLQPGVHITTAYVYETDLDVFAFFDAMCPLYGTDAFPEPFASGDVKIRDRAWNLSHAAFGEEPQAAGRYSNGVLGDIFDDEGNRYRLRAWVTYDLNDEGQPNFLAERLAVQPLSSRR